MNTSPETRRHAGPLHLSTYVLVRRLVREYLRDYWVRLVIAVLCGAVAGAGIAGNVFMLKPVFDEVFVARDRNMLFVVALIVFGLSVVRGVTSYAHEFIMIQVSQRIIARVQSRMFAHLIGSDLAFFNATSTGSLLARFNVDAQLLRLALAKTVTGIAKDLPTVIYLVGVTFYLDWRLAVVSFFVFPAAILPIVVLGKRMRRVSANTQAEMGALTTILDQTFQGARHVKAYNMEAYEAARADRLIERVYRLTVKAARTRSLSRPIMETLGGFAVVAVILYGGNQVIAGETTAGTFIAFVAALLVAYQPVKSLASLNNDLQEGLAAAQRVFDLLDREPAIRDRPDARDAGRMQGRITFDDVKFSYREDAPALRGVSLEIPAGHTVALVGPSGAGKSTILNLIPRFYDVSSGRVLVDDSDVRDLTLASLRANIALVSQEISLFDDTVRANIAYGRPDADDAAIERAARDAAAHDFITGLPQGYETMVGEHGTNLSGGQRQRIAISRAMLKDAPILLLDEATSALDTESERHVQAALKRLMEGRTTLVIAHRLSTVMDADLIHVIQDGRVVESGHHDRLIAQGGVYARLYALQFQDPHDDEAASSPRAAVGH